MLTNSSSVNLEKRQALITSFASFSMLKPSESQVLAKLMVEKHITAGENIVVEDELIDNVYIIISGQAEVRRKIIDKKNLKKTATLSTPIALLGPHDSIGLSDTGFFSTTGLRTATVVALNDVHVLALALKDLLNFF